MITSIDSELEKEIQAMRAEHELLEDTPFDFFERAPYLYRNNYGERFAAIIEKDSVLFTTDDESWGNKLIRFTKAQAEEAIQIISLGVQGKLEEDMINKNNPLHQILISVGETIFLASVLQTALEKWRCQL